MKDIKRASLWVSLRKFERAICFEQFRMSGMRFSCRNKSKDSMNKRNLTKQSELPYVKEAFLTPSECEILIELIKRYSAHDPRFPARVANELRTEVPVQLVSKHGLDREAGLLSGVRQRCKMEVAKNFEIRISIYPEFMMLQGNYPGDGHARHADNCRYDSNGQKWVPNHTPHRVITVGVYLNECGKDFTGGELLFPVLGKTILAEPGLFVAYYSDHRFEHEVPRVKSGARYSILLWFTDDRTFAE